MHATADRAFVTQWLTALDRALVAADVTALAALFAPDSYWRDLVALGPNIKTVGSPDGIARELVASGARLRASALPWNRTPPRRVMRIGVEVIEAIFTFELADGTGEGVLRLRTDGGGAKAWTLLTARVTRTRPAPTDDGEPYARNFRGPNWLDRRRAALASDARDPAVLIIGAGQAGLAIAARLKHLGVDALIVDREERIGDNWRKRYHALTLHNQVHVNHMPLMPFPPGWPVYIPKDKLANWFEAYVESLELDVWTEADFGGAEYDTATRHWTARVTRQGRPITLRPRHIVMATGASAIPHLPDIPTLAEFRGDVMHASRYTDGEAYAGRRVLVIGTGTSGHDVAQDLQAGGADVTIVQRSPTLITEIEPSAQLAYKLYEEGPPLEDCDLLAAGMPFPLVRRAHKHLTEESRRLDQPLLDRLAARGFKLAYGDDGTGWQFLYLTRGGGYYFNVGCSDLIADGTIGLVQFADITAFEPGGARLSDGCMLPADAVILATCYKGQEYLVAQLFGADVAARVGPIWGFDKDGAELRNMFTATPQPGLWFIAGSLAQCRIYSRYLAFEIQAAEMAG
jgi:putative flavoprotein involved in K+ transport